MRTPPQPRRAFIGASLLALLMACNEHPILPLDQVITATNRQESELPAKTKIDFLFVIDNSASMCEEQDNLSRNFSSFSTWLAKDLGEAADYRLAVISTDLHPNHGEAGQFLMKPALDPMPNCRDADGRPYVPNTGACAELISSGALAPVLRSGPDGNIGRDCPANDTDCVQEDLEKKFRCLSTLGTAGDNFEKGLEAIRMALSCNGPNAARFGLCCVSDQTCTTNEQCGGGSCIGGYCRGCDEGTPGSCTYNPACTIPEGGPQPEFLRPDALQVIVVVSDEDDCSDPASNPAESTRAICKYGPTDQNGDEIPDGYNDRAICGDRTPSACFASECGNLTAQECFSQKCEINRNDNNSCEYYRDDLTTVTDYKRFLDSLKARPKDQLIVATIVGHRQYTESGFEITFNPGHADEGCQGVAPGQSAAVYDPTQHDKTYDECCPQGRCKGSIQPSCASSNGIAFAGRRYLQLAEFFDTSGIGCVKDATPGAPNEDTSLQCVNICIDDFSTPLDMIKDRIVQHLGNYCLDKIPACIVPALELNGESQPEHACETEEEFNDKHNYRIRVRQQCLLDINSGGNCQTVEPPRYLDESEWELRLNESGCPGNTMIKLTEPPPAGAEVFVEFTVSMSGAPPAPAAPDAGLDMEVLGEEIDAAQ
ncbi:hypothetical protein KKF91_19560 [Myxococcota bacterium]|nr:hypothetical protein [Myxococcota bacterium]